MFYYHNGIGSGKRRVVYSVTACKQGYLAKYPDFQIHETSVEAYTLGVIKRFIRTGVSTKGNLPEGPHYLRQLLMI